MGGNAIPKDLFMTTRKTAEEYFDLKDRVEMECAFIPGIRDWKVVEAYRQKESYGDMDVVLCLEENCDLNALRKNICDQFGVRAMFTNGRPRNVYADHGPVSLDSVYSICFSDFQIDFILTPNDSEFIAALSYFAWNDLGNLLGRVAHKFDFKLGHKGLMYPFKDGDYQFEEMLVSDDWHVILPAFDYDFQRWAEGFDTREEIFEFVASSKYFSPDIYLFENRNAKARYRDKKRQTYTEFLAWCEQNKHRWPETSKPLLKDADDKKDIFDALDSCDFRERYNEAWHRFHQWRVIRVRFNGDLVREWTGLVDKPLGQFMTHIRNTIPVGFNNGNRDVFNYWVCSTMPADIEAVVKAEFRKWNESNSK